METKEWISLVLAALNSLAALGAIGAAFASARATNQATAAANALAQIERDRRHAEMTPVFRFEYRNDLPGQLTATLTVELAGPIQLDSLDSITFRFRGDGYDRKLVDNVFGPVRFEAGIDGAPNRTASAPKSLGLGEILLLQVHRTESHVSEWAGQHWEDQFWTQPVRLVIECHKAGYEPWFVVAELERPRIFDPPGQFFA